MRSPKGSSLIELAASAFCLSIMVLLCINTTIVIYGTAVHDRCCREAARAASRASTKATAMTLAQAALNACKTDGVYVSQPTFTSSDMTYQDFNGTPLPDQVPTVALITHSNIKLPLSFMAVKAFFGTSNSQIPSTCRYVFPLTNLNTPIPPPGT